MQKKQLFKRVENYLIDIIIYQEELVDCNEADSESDDGLDKASI